MTTAPAATPESGIHSPFNACMFRDECRRVERERDQLRNRPAPAGMPEEPPLIRAIRDASAGIGHLSNKDRLEILQHLDAMREWALKIDTEAEKLAKELDGMHEELEEADARAESAELTCCVLSAAEKRAARYLWIQKHVGCGDYERPEKGPVIRIMFPRVPHNMNGYVWDCPTGDALDAAIDAAKERS